MRTLKEASIVHSTAGPGRKRKNIGGIFTAILFHQSEQRARQFSCRNKTKRPVSKEARNAEVGVPDFTKMVCVFVVDKDTRPNQMEQSNYSKFSERNQDEQAQDGEIGAGWRSYTRLCPPCRESAKTSER